MRQTLLDPASRLLDGMAYGVAQRTMLAVLNVGAGIPGGLESFDRFMASVVEEPLPDRDGLGGFAHDVAWSVLHWHAALQRLQKVPVFGQGRILAAREYEAGLEVQVALPCASPEATRLALRWTLETCAGFLSTSGAGRPSRRAEVNPVLDALRPFALAGVNNFHFLAAAHHLGVPWRDLLPGMHFFGAGRQSCWLRSSMTSGTSALGTQIAHSKRLSARLLRSHGLPAPVHVLVANEAEALAAARHIGLPVVVKPDDQEQGRGVMAGLRDEASVVRAYRAAREHSDKVLVERHCDGEDFRMTVFRGRVVKIMSRRAAAVTGDGRSSVRELVEAIQNSPRFSRIHRQTGQHLLEFDEEAAELLGERGLGPDSVLAPGVRIPLRRKNNISAGGEQLLVSNSDVHPDNLRLAVRAAEALNLDLAGIDLIIPEIRRSWFDSDCVINEVNAIPQIGITLAPETYASILDALLEGQRGVPVHLLVLAGAVPPAAELRILARGCNGISTPEGVWVDDHRIAHRLPGGFEAARILLLDRNVNVALCAISADEIVRLGAPTARFASITVLGDVARTRSVTQALRMLRDFGPVPSAVRSTNGR